MDYNYHAHTFRCHHASGKPEEYVKRAISCGVKYMGFSDHVPFVCADGSESTYRVHTSEAKAYCDEIKALAQKYSDKIELKVGYEMEYYPDNFKEMLKFASESGAEYFILGQHFLRDESFGAEHTILETDSLEKLKIYVLRVVEGIKSGVYSYVAHPDIFNYKKDINIYRNEMRKICIASKECNIPLEINFLGIRDSRNYPNEDFFKLAGEEKSPVTFGFDAHDVESAYDGESLKKAEEIVKKYKLNYIGKPNIISIANK